MDWGLILKIVIFLAIITMIFRFVGSMLRIGLVILTVLAGIWLYSYVTSDDFSADKLAADLGKAVQKMEEMSPKILEVSADTIKTIKDTGSKIEFKKNGLAFNGNENELKGTIALEEGKVKLHATAPLSDDSAVKSLVAILNVFAGDDSASGKIKNMIKTSGDQRVELTNGHIDIKKGVMTIEYIK